MSFSITAVPYEVLALIALETACIDVLGPPSHLPALLCTCKHIYCSIGRSVSLFASIFKAKFDTTAVRRRFGPIGLLNQNLAAQLRVYCKSLSRIRNGDIYAPTINDDLWTAYIMMTENDGKNAVQLKEYARLPAFAGNLVRTRLPESRGLGDWPEESDVVNLGLWLMWMCTDAATLQAETPDQREQFIRLLLPFVICAFHYPAFHAADLHFVLPLERDELPDYPRSSITVHGPFPQYIRSSKVLWHYNQRISLARPPAVQAAQLLYFARRELRGLPTPRNIPANRTEALALGLETGPTRADYDEFNAHPCARLLRSGSWNAAAELTTEERQQEESPGWIPCEPPTALLSGSFDADWNRLICCLDPWSNSDISGIFACYSRGALSGRWVGRMLVPAENQYMGMIGQEALPPGFSESYPFTTVRPLMMTLKEYHCISPEEPIESGHKRSPNEIDDGLTNAYMPRLDMLVEPNSVAFKDMDYNSKVYRYERIRRGQPSSHNSDTCDYCRFFSEQDEQARRLRRSRREEIEAAFEEGGLGHSAYMDTEEDDSVDEMSVDDEDGSGDDSEEDGDEWEMTVESGACHGVLDVVFTGLTEKRHGDAWCHYMYYGRLRTWDGLIVIVGVPNDINERLWGRWIFRGYLHAGQNFTGRWRHYAYDVYHPPYEGAFSLSKREEEDNDE